MSEQRTIVRVALVGIGKRARTVYLPMLKRMSAHFSIVGFTSRHPDRGMKAATDLGLRFYSSITALNEQATPDVYIVCVPGRSVGAVMRQLVLLHKPILLETPIAPSYSRARSLARYIERHNARVAVAEQKPFLPMEQFKQRLIQEGVLGKITVVENDFRTYDYHGIAQLRRYLHAAQPRSALALSTTGALTEYQAAAGAEGPRSEKWDMGMAACTDGRILIHHYNSIGKTVPFRGPKSLRIYGEKGSMYNNEVWIVNAATRETEHQIVQETRTPAGALLSLHAQFSFTTYRWENPWSNYSFTDDEIALATQLGGLHAMATQNATPLCSYSEALKDYALFFAFKYSARMGGKRVSLPLRPTIQFIRQFFSIAFWRYFMVRLKIH